MKRYIIVGLTVWLSFTSVYALTLNGAAQFNRLSTSLYLAALYLPSKNNDAHAILKNEQRQRMDIYVLSNEWRPRQWQRQWLNDISISTPPKQLEKMKDSVHDFAQLLPAALVKNDHISIEFYPDKGTSVRINGVLFLQTDDRDLFQSLLSIWIGELPPSRQFKKQILGEDLEQKWLSFLTDFQPNKKRIAMANSWKQDQDEKTKLLKEKQLQLAAINAPITAETKQKSIPKPRYESLTEEQKSTFRQNFLLKDLNWRLHKRIYDSVQPPAWIVNRLAKGEIVFRFKLDRNGALYDLTGDNKGMPVMLVADVHRAIKREIPGTAIPSQLDGEAWQFELRFPIKQTLGDIIQPPKKPRFMLGQAN
ncbi:hypothetical protein HF888_00895 [Bermanella marisrubri]|uniref:Chalcone isomerase domain-containing protein n=1 Tax=Bermanella marisrubri TaxID=207949 RepID=Q1N466_9GAMM|nr:chalcone isomerase family protein [Bermanella marisrubri]EAT12999.1 hypothetical protein RED65_14922 [Oceanobacter sp. RED65] [Bermanella marisrubri]QIZ82874.1 hypothetical protein HF888_00895 [Bermanella marisrubri]